MLSRSKSRVSAQSSPLKSKPSADEEVSWSLYILRPVSSIPLYEQMIARAHENVCFDIAMCRITHPIYSSSVILQEESDVEVHHQLLLEGHLLLESRLAALLSSSALSSGQDPRDAATQLSFQLEAENYRKLLRKSASLLADVCKGSVSAKLREASINFHTPPVLR